jgi:hypothetical protein
MTLSATEGSTFVPQLLDGSPYVPQRDDAYVHVRLVEPATPSAAVTVYLSDGTALVVRAHDLVRLAPAHDSGR